MTTATQQGNRRDLTKISQADSIHSAQHQTATTKNRRIKIQLTLIALVYSLALPCVVYLSSSNAQLLVWLLYALLALFSLVYFVSKHETSD